MDRKQFERIWRLSCFACDMMEHILKTRGETILIDLYTFCQDNMDGMLRVWKGGDVGGWEVWLDSCRLSEDEVYNLIKGYKDLDGEPSLDKEQIGTINDILKIYANTSGLFVDKDGKPLGEDELVALPYTGRKVTINEIRRIRMVLKHMANGADGKQGKGETDGEVR